MNRPLVVGIMVATLLVSGCATQSVAFVPPGVDRDELLATIAENGQGSGLVEPVAPGKPDRLTTILVGGVEVTGKLAVMCAVLAVVAGAAFCHGNTSGISGFSDGLTHLWTKD